MSRSLKFNAKFPAMLLLKRHVFIGIGVAIVFVSSKSACLAQGAKWYRGNMHTHSLWSDGDDYPEMIAKWYRDHGYNFLTFTDHNTLQSRDRWSPVDKNAGKRDAYDKLKATFPDWVDERTVDGKLQVRLRKFDETREKLERKDEFIMLHGEEISDRFPKTGRGAKPLHLNVSNIKEMIPPLGGGSVREVLQNNINAVMKQRERTGQPMMIHVNHPNFGYAVSENDLMRLVGEKFFEVYNGHPSVHNRGDAKHIGTERMWDVILTMRLGVLELPLMYGIAVDDGHNYHNRPKKNAKPGRGWVMVRSKELSPGGLINSLERGDFYSSSGVTLAEVAATKKSLAIRVKPDKDCSYTIEFIGTTRDAVPTKDKGDPTKQEWSRDIGRVLKTVKGVEGKYEFTSKEVYVRARVTSSRKHQDPSEPNEFERAWVQPVQPK